ncbi:ANK [Mytilus edulis]|uniref:ANK n=1 Tax=Mytilus edulis TaxID=6550 RepID=A0A8S3QEQ3_MYTED|nr:ANK [Mytilus edulis]
MSTHISPPIKNRPTAHPLHIAVKETTFVQLLLEQDIDPDKVNKANGDTPLHIAVRGKNLSIVQLLLERGDIDPDKVNKYNETPIDVFKARNWMLEEDNKIKRAIQELFKFHALGLPVEIRTLDKDSAKVFTHLLEEESYPHFESRVILAGEQGTGKTTIARYLVGKGPTKVRKSTDGIGLYTGLSYIDRDTDEWLDGKQGT